MRLTDYEVEIKNRISQNREDPEIYNLLQELSYRFLLRKKVCKSLKDAEDISYVIAGDTFMKIRDGETYSYILGYLERIYKGYIRDHYQNSTDVISLDSSDRAHDIFGWSTAMYDFNKLDNKIYLERFDSIIDEVMEDSCKYKIGSTSYLNLKLSLVLSLIRDQVSPFHLSSEETFYLRLIIPNVYARIKDDGIGINDAGVGGKSGYARSTT